MRTGFFNLRITIFERAVKYMLLSELLYISMINEAHKCRLKNGRNEVGRLEKMMAVCK